MKLTEHLTSSSSLRSAKSESELSSSHSLTAHFSLAEFQRSATATAKGIDNTIPEALIPSIKNLCEQVLEPLRAHINSLPRGEGKGEAPVIISSGYRCPELNKAVGGVTNSQHMKGEAADIGAPLLSTEGDIYSDRQRKEKLRDWFLWLMDNTDFDQLLFERSGSTTWIHVSCKPDVSKNRHMVRHIHVQT